MTQWAGSETPSPIGDWWEGLDAWDRYNIKLMVLGLALAGFVALCAR